MKRKMTKIMPDGSKVIMEEHDEAPAMSKAKNTASTAAKGQNGDTELAHVNRWEEALLKRMGGVGTRNPKTGLKQFYIDPATGLETPDFDMPLDIMPTSGSTNVSTGTNESYNLGSSTSNNASANQSASNSSNYAGLQPKYRDILMNAITPQLTNAVGNMSANYDDYTNQALGSYQQMMNNALKQNIPAALRNMANRGIINSTEGQNIMGNVYSSAAQDAAGKGYETAMQAALLKANMPTVLAQLADLGKSSYGSSAATSYGTSSGSSSSDTLGTSTGNTASYGTSFSQDPTVMYRTMADMIKAMM